MLAAAVFAAAVLGAPVVPGPSLVTPSRHETEVWTAEQEAAAGVVRSSAARAPPARTYRSEVWTREEEAAVGIVRERAVSPKPADTLGAVELPRAFTWCNKDGVNYCTMSSARVRRGGTCARARGVRRG